MPRTSIPATPSHTGVAEGPLIRETLGAFSTHIYADGRFSGSEWPSKQHCSSSSAWCAAVPRLHPEHSFCCLFLYDDTVVFFCMMTLQSDDTDGFNLQGAFGTVHAARGLPFVQLSLQQALHLQQPPAPSCINAPVQGASHNGVALPNLHVEAEYR